MQPKGFTSKILSTLGSKPDVHNAFQVPIYMNGAYDFATAEDMEAAFTGKLSAHAYSRSSNPTVENLELRVKKVTDASGVLALSSGLAAISTAMMTLCNAGDNFVTSHHLFGNTWSLFAVTFASFGIEARFVDLSNEGAIIANIDSKTRAIFFETITNPQTEVVDIAALSKIAKQHSLVLLADTTLTPPNIFKAKEWGIDIEILSNSKIMSGGGTSIGGTIIDYATFDWTKTPKLLSFTEKFKEQAFYAKLRKEVYRNTGACLSPLNAYMQSLGLETLTLRFEKSASNALKLARFLEQHPKVQSVNYPGLESSDYYSIAIKQFGLQPTSILSFTLLDRQTCFAFLNNLSFISIATNLMDNRTLVLHPGSTIYSEYTIEQKLQMNVSESLIRLSVGIEEIEDLLSDIEQAFAFV